MADLEKFRAETAQWLEANCPPEMREPFEGDWEFCWGGSNQKWLPGQRAWLQRMVEKGWTAPSWPVQYGGGGLDDAHTRVLWEEVVRLGCRPPLVGIFGLGMIGPVLLRYGSEQIKQRFLPPIVRGEVRWCQGYSEPGYGSDLAGLQMRAVRDGDHFVVDGQKVWTSYANKADWIFCLVRSNTEVSKHQGISLLLVDMNSPGVSTQPIKLISGGSPFCETFFDGVRVPVENLVGEVDRGWGMAKVLLSHERTTISAQNERVKIKGSEAALQDVAREQMGGDEGPLPDPIARQEIARVAMDQRAHALTTQRVFEQASSGSAGHEASIIKYYYAELNKRRQDLRVRLSGLDGCGFQDRAHFTDAQLRTTTSWLRSRANSIEGGTAEIQLNIIAKRVLGLPE